MKTKVPRRERLGSDLDECETFAASTDDGSEATGREQTQNRLCITHGPATPISIFAIAGVCVENSNKSSGKIIHRTVPEPIFTFPLESFKFHEYVYMDIPCNQLNSKHTVRFAFIFAWCERFIYTK